MKKNASIYFSLFCIIISVILTAGVTGCANIIPPSGGPRDTLPPVLVASLPVDSATNVTSNRVSLLFNEYVGIENALENVLISPTPNNTPVIDYKLRTVSVRLRDTLEPNTTYSINFGNAIKDVNEGNIYRDFTFVFSTGSNLDENTLGGKIILAQTGKIDTTLLAVLHRNLDDSSVAKEKPRYITRLDGKGNFMFRNLPSGIYALYAIPNEYSRRYDDSTKPFAFANAPINLDSNLENVVLYAFQKEKVTAPAISKTPAPATTGTPNTKDKQLRFGTNMQGNTLDILGNLQLEFNQKITAFDSTKILLTDKDFRVLSNYTITPDTNKTVFVITHPWPPNTPLNLVIQKDAFADSSGLTLAKDDTLRINTKRQDEYGSLRLRFNNLDFSKNPVLQLVQNDQVATSSPLTQREWYRKLFQPGGYQVRILYDANKNGKWDTGEYFGERRQPEIVVDLKTDVDVRADWDNEKDITLAGQ